MTLDTFMYTLHVLAAGLWLWLFAQARRAE